MSSCTGHEAGASTTCRHSSSVPPRWMTSNTAANFCCPPTKPSSSHLHESGADLVAYVSQRAGAVSHEHCEQQRGGKGSGGLRGIVRHCQVICHRLQGLMGWGLATARLHILDPCLFLVEVLKSCSFSAHLCWTCRSAQCPSACRSTEGEKQDRGQRQASKLSLLGGAPNAASKAP